MPLHVPSHSPKYHSLDNSVDCDRYRDIFRGQQHYMSPSPAFVPSHAARPPALYPSMARSGDPIHHGSLPARDDSRPFFDWEQTAVRLSPSDILTSRSKRPRMDPSLFESGRARKIVSDLWEESHMDRRLPQDCAGSTLASVRAQPFSYSSLLDETNHSQSVGSCRKPVKERLSRPSPRNSCLRVRHVPLQTKQSGNPTKKSKGNPSVSGALTPLLKGKNANMDDRLGVNERGVKGVTVGSSKSKLDGTVKLGPAKRMKRPKQKTKALASVNLLSTTTPAINGGVPKSEVVQAVQRSASGVKFKDANVDDVNEGSVNEEIDLREESENKVPGSTVMGEQKVRGIGCTDSGGMDMDAKIGESLHEILCPQEVHCCSSDNFDKGFLNVGSQPGGLGDFQQRDSLRGKIVENESERRNQIENYLMEVHKYDDDSIGLDFIERKNSRGLNLEEENNVLDEDGNSGTANFNGKVIQQNGATDSSVGDEVDTGPVLEVHSKNVNGGSVVSAHKRMGTDTVVSSPYIDRGEISVDNQKPAVKPIEREEFGSNLDARKNMLKSDMKIRCQLAEKMPRCSKELEVDTVSRKRTTSSIPAASFSAETSSPLGVIKRKASTSLNHMTNRARTWHRTGNNNSSESLRKLLKTQTISYVRKGHSLVRKTSPVTAMCTAAPSLGLTSSECRKHALAPEIGASPSIERPATPPLFSTSKMAVSTGKTLSSEVCPSKPSETLLASLAEGHNGKSKMTYVKCKSNQLVATYRPEMANSIKEKAKLSSIALVEGYYKRKKNQIVRNIAPSEVQSEGAVAVMNENQISEAQKAVPKAPLLKFSGGLSKRRLQKVFQKTFQPSKFSLVWTLSGAEFQKDRSSLQRKKVLPYLFPWKRTTYLQYMSLISKKRQHLRKRDTVYTRSATGFSLRKSKVPSVNTRNLKWLESMESHSKQVNKEANITLDEAEKWKTGESGGAFVVPETVDGNWFSGNFAHGINLLPGERIFRVGSDQYKMDASKKTLVRISDEKMSTTTSTGDGSNSTKCVETRKLMIGNDQYILTGKGNTLVRDARKLKHILASEKVRWSLHTTRLKLARKQQYCQFFTRFGKCNKEDGKCAYIHDPNKIAVCTKFLKGLCLGLNCKLTHKVIPERMQDCSYFLQGLCTNENCPYRHVNVNPSASICEGFLRGYCADGNECRKKHTYVCPHLEKKGVCPLGPQCKLYHPKKSNKCRKRKCAEEQRNRRGRYFCSLKLINDGGNKSPVSVNPTAETGVREVFFGDGQYADFISLDIGEEEAEVVKDPIDRYSILAESEFSEPQTDNLGDLIRPVLLMR